MSKSTSITPVAIVTGASRGAGRGIAVALGSHGCTVYVTGRTINSGDHPLPGTISEAAQAVTAAGGNGIAMACDHADDTAVEALFARVLAEQGRIDLLVNNAAAIYDEIMLPRAFWEKPLKLGDLINVGIRSGYVASWHAAKVMAQQNSGLIVFTSASGAAHYSLGPAYGAHKVAMDKMAFDIAADFRYSGVDAAAISIWMGALLTDRLKAIITNDTAKYGHLEGTCENPEFTGHVIWEVFKDPNRAALNGQTVVGAAIARNYGLTDQGRVPRTAQELHGVEPIQFHPVEIR